MQSRPSTTKKNRSREWLCKCTCGEDIWVNANSLLTGNTTSCGCSRKGNTCHLIHGYARHSSRNSTYQAWAGMRTRCRNRNGNRPHRYVKRGITVCDRCKNFEAFLEDMGDRPAGMTLERKNNNLGYSPENCCWETQTKQQRNRCNTKLTFDAAVSNSNSSNAW